MIQRKLFLKKLAIVSFVDSVQRGNKKNDVQKKAEFYEVLLETVGLQGDNNYYPAVSRLFKDDIGSLVCIRA